MTKEVEERIDQGVEGLKDQLMQQAAELVDGLKAALVEAYKLGEAAAIEAAQEAKNEKCD